MDRRKFICRVTGAAASAGLTLAGAAAATENRSVVYKVNGFTCINCAVGPEVMLRGLKGVTRANASYPRKKVSIGFDSNLASEKELKDFIARCGFSVA
jgi:copper chaperone CopZ